MRKTAIDIIRAAQARAGYRGQQQLICKLICMSPTTFSYKLNKGEFTTSELRRLDMVLRFEDAELAKIIRGK